MYKFGLLILLKIVWKILHREIFHRENSDRENFHKEEKGVPFSLLQKKITYVIILYRKKEILKQIKNRR